MTPRLTPLNATNIVLAYPVVGGYVALKTRVETYRVDLVWGENCAVNRLTSNRAFFSRHVRHVGYVIPHKKMVRVDTSPIITTMENIHLRVQKSVRYSPRHSMSAIVHATNVPVPQFRKRATPHPTLVIAAPLVTALKKSHKSRRIAHVVNIEIHWAAPRLDDRAGSSASNALPPAFSTNPSAFTQAA
jgi:hypothetical protein